eukprot:150549-Prymnesium_polylepis.1
MGCGASSQQPGAEAPDPALPPPEAKSSGEAFEFTTEDPSVTLFRGIARKRSMQENDRPFLIRKDSDSAKKFARAESARQVNASKHSSPEFVRASTRADAVINGRPANVHHQRRARVAGPKLGFLQGVPPQISAEKDKATTTFLRKAVRSHQNTTLFGELTEGAVRRLRAWRCPPLRTAAARRTPVALPSLLGVRSRTTAPVVPRRQATWTGSCA